MPLRPFYARKWAQNTLYRMLVAEINLNVWMNITGTDTPVYNMHMETQSGGRDMPLGMDVLDGQAYLATAPEDIDYINFQFDLST